MKKAVEQKLDAFIKDWPDSPEGNRQVFLRLLDTLKAKEAVVLDFLPRPGVTYSLRAVHANQKNRELFVMIDVIEDDPRWLSVCFYAEMITDPEDRGDFVPQGLFGEDAMCFDLEEKDDDLVAYIETRIVEAWRSAAAL